MGKSCIGKINLGLICRLFKYCGILVKANSFKNNIIFDYDSFMIDKNKENDELIDETSKDDEFEKEEEEDYNNWNELNFANISNE